MAEHLRGVFTKLEIGGTMADLGEPTGSEPLGLADRLVRGISVDGIIEKLFRFIEMIVIATLIGVAMRVVSVEGSELVSSGLAFAAGLYLSIHTARWVGSIIRPSQGSGSPPEWMRILLFGLVFGVAAISMTSGLRFLLSETFQVNEPRARVEYQLWRARSRLTACHGGPPKVGPPPAKDIPACERMWRSEIVRLEAEEQGLEQ
jgi:hypothetical protein